MAKKDRKVSDESRPKRQSAEVSETLTREAIAARLEALARDLRAGRLVLVNDDERLDVPVADEIDYELKARSSGRGKKASFKIEVAWRGNNTAAPEAVIALPAASITEPVSSESPVTPPEHEGGPTVAPTPPEVSGEPAEPEPPASPEEPQGGPTVAPTPEVAGESGPSESGPSNE